jgi:hypothetical protein
MEKQYKKDIQLKEGNFILKKETHIENIKELCEIEQFIIRKGSKLTKKDKEMLNKLENIMTTYTYGWYIYYYNFLEQLTDINNFKIYILELINKENEQKYFTKRKDDLNVNF